MMFTKKVKRRILSVSAILILCCSMLLETKVLAADKNEDFVLQKYHCDSLPQKFNSNISFQEIEQDIFNYINYRELNIEKGTEEYLELMYSVLFGELNDITELTQRYYEAYASVYVVEVQEGFVKNSNEKVLQENYMPELKGSIEERKQENIQRKTRMLSEKENENKSARASYSVSKAQEYAKQYALSWNYVYGRYTSDCTNFASQIVHNAGMPLVSGEWQWNGNETAKRNWNVAWAFTEYWTLIRGYNGGDYTIRADVNRVANPGDFIAYMAKDTYEIWHVAFVQSKSDGLVYISQHTKDRYNEKWNDISLTHSSTYIVIKFS